jgi:hypothetical protein
VKYPIFSRRKNQPSPATHPANPNPGNPGPPLSDAGEETPEARQARVDQLRRQIHSGTYQIPFYQLVRILAALFRRNR